MGGMVLDTLEQAGNYTMFLEQHCMRTDTLKWSFGKDTQATFKSSLHRRGVGGWTLSNSSLRDWASLIYFVVGFEMHPDGRGKWERTPAPQNYVSQTLKSESHPSKTESRERKHLPQ